MIKYAFLQCNIRCDRCGVRLLEMTVGLTAQDTPQAWIYGFQSNPFLKPF